MKKRGFTLVELLAVITLIGILGLLTVPIINTTIKNSRKKAFNETLNSIVDAAKIYNADTDYLVMTDGVRIDITSDAIAFENKGEILSGYIYYSKEEYYFEYVESEYFCASGSIKNIRIYEKSEGYC